MTADFVCWDKLKHKREVRFLYLSEKAKFSIIIMQERKTLQTVNAKRHPIWGLALEQNI